MNEEKYEQGVEEERKKLFVDEKSFLLGISLCRNLSAIYSCTSQLANIAIRNPEYLTCFLREWEFAEDFYNRSVENLREAGIEKIKDRGETWIKKFENAIGRYREVHSGFCRQVSKEVYNDAKPLDKKED